MYHMTDKENGERESLGEETECWEKTTLQEQ